MLLTAAHFSFTVSAIESSRHFYGDVLGLQQIYEIDHTHPYTSRQVGFPGAHLKAVGFRLGQNAASSHPTLELIEYRAPRGRQIDLATNNLGVAHLAFEVDDIFQEYERLVGVGVQFRSEPVRIEAGRNTGGYTAYFLDPDGITLELAQPPADPAFATGERRSVAAQAPWAAEWGYARAVRVGDRIEVGGTTAVNSDGQVVSPGDAYAQTRFVLSVIAGALRELDATLEDVVRTRAFLRDVKDWREVGRAHREAFGVSPPTSSCVGGSDLLNPALLVEIEAAAIVRGPELRA